MRLKALEQSLVLIACIAFLAQTAMAEDTWQDSLNPDSLKIVSPYYTEEYLKKMGALPASGISAMKVAGNWSFDLKGSMDRPLGKLTLRLFQAEGWVFGLGTLKSGLQAPKLVAADGAVVEGNVMILGVVSMQDVNLYRITINDAGGNKVSGSFNTYSSNGALLGSGILEGSREEPRKLS